ncbi:MAG: 16S rRNA (uracil(1498)-N(3))-methyltransferase, partial [Vicinamibacterales bacterium]
PAGPRMRVNRFYLPGAAPRAVLPLPEDEAAHAVRVLRVAPGDAVRVFDGEGHEFPAVVRTIAKGRVEVELGEAVAPPAPEMALDVTLAMAVLKGDHMDGVVRDATMLGVRALVPVVTARTETSRAALERGSRAERWRRVAVASAKQCGRAVVPAMGAPVDVETLLAGWQEAPAAETRLVCVEPSAAVDAGRVQDVGRPASGRATILVGPEGGWAPAELEALLRHAGAVMIGQRTLRAETAPLVALVALLTAWREI